MTRMRQTALILVFFLCSLAAQADQKSGPGKRTLAETSWGTVFCNEGSTVVPGPRAGRFTVETPSGKIGVVADGDDVIVQYPDRDLRLRYRHDGPQSELLVQFDLKNYRFLREKKELIWKFPQEEAFFRFRGTRISDVLGDRGILKVRRRVPKGLYRVFSEAGESELQVSGDQRSLEVVEGELPERHFYLRRGVVFSQGPVGVFVSLPGGELFEALDWSTALRIETQMPEPKQPQQAAEPERDPLKANKPDWHSPVTNTQPTDPSLDPLNLKHKPTGPPTRDDKLKAKTAPNSEDVLKVKGYDDDEDEEEDE